MRMKYVSYDNISYMYDMFDDAALPFSGEVILGSDLKIAG